VIKQFLQGFNPPIFLSQGSFRIINFPIFGQKGLNLSLLLLQLLALRNLSQVCMAKVKAAHMYWHNNLGFWRPWPVVLFPLDQYGFLFPILIVWPHSNHRKVKMDRIYHRSLLKWGPYPISTKLDIVHSALWSNQGTPKVWECDWFGPRPEKVRGSWMLMEKSLYLQLLPTHWHLIGILIGDYSPNAQNGLLHQAAH